MKKESVYYKAIQGKSMIGTEAEVPELFEVAEKRGIQLPSPHLAIFKTVYAKIEDANLNNVRLEKSAVHEAMPTLIGKQVNLNHWRKGFILGHIIDASINASEEIEVTFIFYKDVYIEDFDRAVDQFKNGDLTVSFELYAGSREDVGDGTVRLLSIDFAGMGLLLDEDPAYPGAVVFEMAKKVKQRIQEATSGLFFAKEIEDNCDQIIHALVKKAQEDTENSDNIDETKETKDTNNKNNQEGGNNMSKITAKEIKALKAELGDLCKDWSEEDFSDESKVTEARAIIADVEKDTSDEEQKDDAEESEEKEADKADESKEEDAEEEKEAEEKEESEEEEKSDEAGEEKESADESEEKEADKEVEAEKESEEKEEANEESEAEAKEEETESESESDEAKTEYTTETKKVVKESFDEDEIKTEIDKEVTEVVEVDGDEVQKVVTKTKKEETITFSELEEKVVALEKALKEANEKYTQLESSIEDIKENALKIAEYKRVLGEHVKDFSDTDFLNPDKIQIAEQAKEIAELKGEQDNKDEEEKETTETAADTGHDADDVSVEDVKDPVRRLIDLKTSSKNK